MDRDLWWRKHPSWLVNRVVGVPDTAAISSALALLNTQFLFCSMLPKLSGSLSYDSLTYSTNL